MTTAIALLIIGLFAWNIALTFCVIMLTLDVKEIFHELCDIKRVIWER